MAKLSHTDSRRMYSWWWDSHISPKNSKWLQENLTDMDAKVKVMIKLIEEDADSFARRAEMYYKKRPELMRMVEEFYRAYRALAERYDHATGVIRHAHRTMAEAFPNQVPSMFADDSPGFSGTDPRTPDEHALKQNGEFTDESDTVARRRALKQQLNDPFGSVERVRKGLNFDETEEKENTRSEKSSKPDEERESEEILKLKEYIAKLESEKEAGLVKYQESVDKLSQLELEISQTREDFKVYSDRAAKAENEVVILKESLSKLESEKELKLQEYERSLERISDLEAITSTAREDAEKSNQRACVAETEAQSLRGERDKMAVEKDAALDQYLQSLEAISNLENKLRVTEEDASQLKERAEKAESEIEILKQTISKLTNDKEAAALQYQQCLETISSLEDKLTRAQDEAKLLNQEIDSGVSKLKGAEEKCLRLERSNQSLHSELESLMLKMGTQNQDLTEKQKELGQLWACLQEERLRFVEAETAFQTLQHLHGQTQEELRSMASELQKRAQLLDVSQTHNQSLQDEVLKVKEENKHLEELNASSSSSIKDMQNEISDLKDSKGKLVEEVELRLDERNALQQEIYCLKEELNDLLKKHHSVMDQVNMVGLNPESLGPSVRELQDENSNLKETWDRERRDKEAVMEKLEIMEQLLEKNRVLETSLSDLNAELDAVRGKIETLEQSLQSLLKEKSSLLNEKASLMTQLQEANKNLESLTENNTVMANSLSDAHNQLQMLVAKAKTLEDSCQLLKNEKADLIGEKHCLNSQLENTLKRLEELGKDHGELEGRYVAREKERDSTLRKVQELQISLEEAKLEHGNYIQISESRLIGVEAEMRDLHEECRGRKRELDEVIDNAMIFEIEIFVLQRIAQELKQNNFSLIKRNEQLLEKSTSFEKIMKQLEKTKVEQQVQIKSLSDQASSQRAGTCQLLKVLNIVHDPALVDKAEQHQFFFDQLFSAIQDLKMSLCKAEEENQHWAVELSVFVEWIRQLRHEAQNLDVEKSNIEHEFKERSERLSAVEIEVIKHLETNENLRLKLNEGNCIKEALMIQIEDLQRNLTDMRGTCETLQREKSEVYEEKRSLMEKFLQLEEKNNVLEEENCVLCDKVLALDNHSLILRSYAEEKLMAVKELGEDRNKLHDVNDVLVGKLRSTEGSLEALTIQIEGLRRNLVDMQGTCETLRREKTEVNEEKRSLMEKLLHLEENNNVLEEENCVLCDKFLALDNHSLILRSCAEEKLMAVRELGEDRNKLHDVNDVLVGKLSSAEGRLEALMSQIEDLRRKLMDMQGTCETSRREMSEVYEEKRSLMEKFLHLEEKNNVLEEENCVLCEKVLALDNHSLILRSCAEEKLMAVRELGEERNKLHDVNDVIVGKLSSAEGRLEESDIEILHLKQQLQRSENELKVVATVKDQLSDEIENGKNVLHQMKLELQEAEQKINIVEKKKFELHKIVEDLKFESDEFKTIRDYQENQIFNLSTMNDNLSAENNRLHEASQILEGKLHDLNEELSKSKSDGEILKNELKMKGGEIDELEIQAASAFGQLQHSMVCQLLFKQKFHELEGACLDYIDQNEGLKNQLAAFRPEIDSLKACVASLENHTDQQIMLQNPENEDLQGADVINDLQGIVFNEDEKAPMQDMVSELRDLHGRLQAYEKASAATKEAMVQESIDLRSKLDTSLRQIDFLKSESWRYRRSLKQTSEISEAENTLLMKDIMLDQISNGSPYGVSSREPIDTDNQIVELQENIDPKKNLKGGFLASDEPVVEESNMDKLEISKRFSGHVQEENKKKVLERLDSDVQKLANLQITVQDMKRKLQVTEKGKRGKSVIECEALKGKLEEADGAIIKLFDFNGRLIKTVEHSTFSDVKSSFDLEGDVNARRKVSEQARRMSEKIGRLQLEVQKLQFILLKLGDEKEVKPNISDIKRRVLLRDYLYGGRRTGQGQKKAPFCGCFEPSAVDR